MQRRTLGSTGLQVSPIGFGAWQLGNAKDWSHMSNQEAIHLVHTAIDQGCNFFDTAPGYGLGKSEELLGQALQGKREQVVLTSKCGHHANGESSFDPQKLIASVEDSLRRLQTEYLDCLLLHNPPFEGLNGSSPQLEALHALKQQGKIRTYGASIDSSREIEELVTTSDSQVIEIMFNILYQEPLAGMKLAKERGVGLIVKVPLDSGWLSGKYSSNSQFTGVRSRWNEQQIRERGHLVGRIRAIVGEDIAMIHAALRFILAHPEVSTVIPGIKNLTQLQQNLAAAEESLPDAIVQQLHTFWEQEVNELALSW